MASQATCVSSECSAVCSSELALNLTAKIFQLERPLLFWVLQINNKRGKEERKGASLQIHALASCSIRTRTFFHESPVLDAPGLVVTLESGAITLPGFMGLHSGGRQTGEQRSLIWGANLAMPHATAGMMSIQEVW